MTKAANLAAAANSTSGYLTASKVQSNGVTTNALAWVNFNGTGTVAIRSSYNVSSITDNGTGDYAVNFTTALSDANYVAVMSSGGTAGAVVTFPLDISIPRTTTKFDFRAANTSFVAADSAVLNVAIFGN